MRGGLITRVAAGSLAVWALALPAAAQRADAGWPPAVGLLTYGTARPGAPVCTGTLVAPDLVLTAAHCVTGTGPKPIDPATIGFAAGWGGEVPSIRRRGAEAIVSQSDGLSGDVALLRLDQPIVGGSVRPLPLALAAAAAGSNLIAVAYGRDDPSRPVVTDGCGLIRAEASLLALSCAVVSGNSGAPLLVRRDGDWQVVAILVARARTPGPIRAYAVVPDPDLTLQIGPGR